MLFASSLQQTSKIIALVNAQIWNYYSMQLVTHGPPTSRDADVLLQI